MQCVTDGPSVYFSKLNKPQTNVTVIIKHCASSTLHSKWILYPHHICNVTSPENVFLDFRHYERTL